jgi:hypothetical protein
MPAMWCLRREDTRPGGTNAKPNTTASIARAGA